MDVAEARRTPQLAVDVRERPYFLKHQSRRAEYLMARWNVVSWNKINCLFSRSDAS